MRGAGQRCEWTRESGRLWRHVMNLWRWVDPRVRDVRIEHVRRYLESRGWCESQSGAEGQLCFQSPGGGNGADWPVCVLPASEQAADDVLSLTYFLTTLSEWEDRHPVAVLEEMLQLGRGIKPARTRAPAP